MWVLFYLAFVSVGATEVDLPPVKSSDRGPYAHLFPSVFSIGGVLSSQEHGETLLKAIEQENSALPNRRLPEGVQLNGTFILMDSNPIRAAKSVCDELIPKQVYVVIASHAVLPSDLSPMAVSFTCGFYKIPVIGLSARESSFSDKVSVIKNLHVMFADADDMLTMNGTAVFPIYAFNNFSLM